MQNRIANYFLITLHPLLSEQRGRESQHLCSLSGQLFVWLLVADEMEKVLPFPTIPQHNPTKSAALDRGQDVWISNPK